MYITGVTTKAANGKSYKAILLTSMDPSIELVEGKSIGAAFTVYQTAKSLGIEKALGTDREGKLSLESLLKAQGFLL